MIFDGMGEMGDKVPAELEPVSKFVAAEVTRRMAGFFSRSPPPHVGSYT
jgi:hypothetical protein